ncbi:hypothetical protein FT663_00994 [Candidozyma haemuli var. vulneris]|uniref:Translation initiation factor beta propellor-like domain-containing protein n=1 Tax=Candidozyma haemuli TaxID=45357 RepID=A0A2V1AY53_9ASCO|nr:hypothetical protein CXQ85_000762 [[Candida] haemuloni]KAF3991683.1 hypothetical protein FT662_01565 [[Candida] haemuloni var. vulneris]KAF3994889.1 hypothetical protein FT663_00994 [[Candida] haemuloni var. vulneris]PVH21771.1 hypothetical protein CXQ85_000762 [[Candida] haemuloni]
MSLTSLELNYLIWRYLQESGFELAAYALQQGSHCLEYEHEKNKLIDSIEPGCLVNLVQKGILYTFVEDAAEGKNERISLVNAILKDNQNRVDSGSEKDASRFTLKKDSAVENGSNDVDMDADSATALSNGKNDAEAEEPEEEVPEVVNFSTKLLAPSTKFSSSLAAQYHPSTSVLAYGCDDSTAKILALENGTIAENVTLNYPPLINGNDQTPLPNEITTVSWSPSGTMVLTAGINGEIRAWTPDGKLKNIVNTPVDSTKVAAPLHTVSWSPRGQFVLTIDTSATVRIWEGDNLTPIQELRSQDSPSSTCLEACWVSENKFALATSKNAIKINSVNPQAPFGSAESVVTVGLVAGHLNPITNLTFSPVSKLLASASDVDYAIKVWNSSSSRDALELNVSTENETDISYHTSPIVGLHWLTGPSDVQGNELLSVSMDGVVNVWDAFTGEAIRSTNIFKSPDSYHFGEENSIDTSNPLIFASALSHDARFLAIGDDTGNVTIWDVATKRYRGTTTSLRCLGFFEFKEQEDAKDVGICDIAWDSKNELLTVCYKGSESVVLKWNGYDE